MKAIRIHENGGYEVLKYEDVEIPTPKAGEVLIKNKAIGVNFIDTYHRSGLYKLPLPLILGREGAGVVEKLGDGVDTAKLGDVVAYFSPQAYAEYVVIHASKIYKLPAGIDADTGAALLLQGLTAYAFVHFTYPLGPGKTALIHAGAGGLGQLLIQFAKILGATVFTTVSSKEKEEIVKKLGADYVINYSEKDFAKEVRELTGGKGVDVVYDSVGKTTWEGSLNSLRVFGYLVLCGNASGPVPPIDPAILSEKGSLYLTRASLNSFTTDESFFKRSCDEIFGWLAQGKFKLSPPTKFPLRDAAHVHELLESRKTTGKLLLIP